MIKLLRWPILSLTMVGLSPAVSAGNDTLHIKNPRVIGIKSHYGFILPHSESIREISNSKPRGFQVDYARHLNTQWVWDYFGTYPRVGVSFAYFNYDNPEILGNSYTLKTYFEPYITYRYRINPTFRIGLGISYLDNVYNPVNNPHNLFYSSPISFFVLTNMGLNYQVNDFFDMTVSANFSHISNGSIKKPNKGINVPSLSMGLEYKLDKVNLEKRSRQLSKHDIHGKLWKISAGLYTSIKEIDTYGKKYHIYGIELTSGLIVNRVSAFNVGIDVSHDRSLREKNKMDVDGSANFSPTILSGILSHELLMGRLIFDQTIGWYINKPSVNSLPYYQKIGIGYRIDRSLSMGLSLKAHRIAADYISLKMGMKL
jgi:hypothetical protein